MDIGQVELNPLIDKLQQCSDAIGEKLKKGKKLSNSEISELQKQKSKVINQSIHLLNKGNAIDEDEMVTTRLIAIAKEKSGINTATTVVKEHHSWLPIISFIGFLAFAYYYIDKKI
jgi:uncharacterized protein YdcH (DUF465 family)